jgi:hypothetical protein
MACYSGTEQSVVCDLEWCIARRLGISDKGGAHYGEPGCMRSNRPLSELSAAQTISVQVTQM